jgi:copper transport protein
VGAVVVAVSFAFDGHTLSEGPRLLHALASVAHVVAASVWAGGLVAFAVVLWKRYRDAVPADALRMTLRFSVIAMVSLAVAGAAGVAMALFIDSDVAGYLSTDWGRVLVVKLVLVAVAGAIGAYNHFRVLPALEADPTDADLIARTRGTVTAEAALLIGAAVVSGLLVAASTI